ncbi:MAG: hypothetical protein D6730_20350 [Bacteroidetes bacterium]|nr:MAG: hypothetical protein D6730_20350 [Bacteroidota bacterium]
MEDFFKKILYTGVGLVSLTAEKLQETVDQLVGDGKMSAEEGKKIVDEFLNSAEAKKDELENRMKQAADEVVSTLKIPTKKDYEELVKRIEALEAKLAAKPASKASKAKGGKTQSAE